MSESFVRRVPHYPRVFLPRHDEHDDGLSRRLAARPGRFLVNNPRSATPDWQIPPDFLSRGAIVAPLQPALYLGRVEDLTPDQGCLVRVWEVPSGLTGVANLTREQLVGQDIAVGDTLRIYTWIEVPLSPTGDPLDERPELRVEVTPRSPLSPAQREALAAAAAALAREAPAEDPE